MEWPVETYGAVKWSCNTHLEQTANDFYHWRLCNLQLHRESETSLLESHWQTFGVRSKTAGNLYFSCRGICQIWRRPRLNYNHTAQYSDQSWCSSDPAKQMSLAKFKQGMQVIVPSQSSYVPVSSLSLRYPQMDSHRACTYPRYRARQPTTALFCKHSTRENTATLTYTGFHQFYRIVFITVPSLDLVQLCWYSMWTWQAKAGGK